MLTVKVAVEKISYESDILYSYAVPDELQNGITIGQRVIVPFGFSGSKRVGVIIELEESVEENKFKSVCAVLDSKPFISSEMILLAKWMKERYFCSYFDILKLILPAGIGNGLSSIRYCFNEKTISSSENLTQEEVIFLNAVSPNKKPFTLKNLIKLKIKNYHKILRSILDKKIIYEEISSSKTVGEKEFKIFNVNKNFKTLNTLTLKQRKICDYLSENKNMGIKEICYFTGVSESTVRNLEKKNIIISSNKTEYYSPETNNSKSNISIYQKPRLSAEQNEAFEKLLSNYRKNEFNVSLLYGITGSGKTQVLLNIADEVLKNNKSVIFMVPEIALTAQFISLFKNRYGEKVVLLHSKLSNWQRFDAWKKIQNNQATVILGTRSAVFAPVSNLGLIVIDEEHEFTYKSESTPRFDTRDVAKYLCKLCKASLILSSATPSVESYYKAKEKKYSLVTLKNRYANAQLPEVYIADMNLENELCTNSFGSQLKAALKENFKAKKQSIIFINRRGYNHFAKCRNCGEILCCPNCSVSLNYHKSNNRLMCHYCGYSKEFTTRCAKCNQEKICYLGAGTQKIEDSLKEIVPDAKILRIDSDVKNLKSTIENELKDFAEGKYDILVGTQMISKGFNFPNVTLVGVVSVDNYLYSGDFQSYEKTFSLLTQVIGRAGRGDSPGRAIIQTFSPENEIFEFASSQNYESFFNSEIKLRKALLYPPFSDICTIVFASENEKSAQKCANQFFEDLKNEALKNYSNIPLKILPPRPAMVKKVAGKYRYKIFLKCRNDKTFRNMLSDFLKNFGKQSSCKHVHYFVSFNNSVEI